MQEPENFPLNSLDIKEQQLEKLRSLFPEIFTEGTRIDWDRLKNTLGNYIDPGKERFGLNWHGKAECFRTIQQPSMATLTPCPEESLKADGTPYAKGEGFSSGPSLSGKLDGASGNIFIEGDNLEVLKLLQKSYQNKVKMIYIDPPYNTGNEFIYPDNYSETLDTYLEYTGQTDGEGRKFSTNVDTDGRFHSKWLNMMYPRLFLAKNLLKSDGFIFISIDDNEVHNLKGLCNEIFGEDCFVGSVVRTTGQTTGQDSEGLGSSFDYLLVFSKQPNIGLNGLELTDHDLKRFENEDERGKYAYDQMRKTGSSDKREDRPNMWYKVDDPDGNPIFPIGPGGYESRWRFEEKTYLKLKEDNFILWKKTSKEGVETWWPYVKYYLEGRTKRPSPLWDDLEGNKKAARDLRSIFDGKKIFDYPKPIELLERIISISCGKDDLVLDYFAGSGSLAHATLKLNDSDSGNRKFICVQLPEPTDYKSEAHKAGFTTIAQISKERIRRVSSKMAAELKAAKEKAKSELFKNDKINENQDFGFHVFKLQNSHFKVWNAGVAKEAGAIQTQIFDQVEHISPKASQENILFELLLKAGFRLDTRIESLSLAGKQVFSIADGELLICLEKELTHEVITAMAELQPSRVICLDLGFQNNDQLKTNAVQIMKSKKVLNFQTV